MKAALNYSLADNGMFYMVWEDFVERFNVLELCLRQGGRGWGSAAHRGAYAHACMHAQWTKMGL